MSAVVMVVNWLTLLATLVGRPAPAEVGAIELGVGVLCALALILAAGALHRARRPLAAGGSAATLVTGLLLGPVVLSLAVAAWRDVGALAALRAAVPYLAFVGFALAGVTVPPARHRRLLTLTVTAVGSVHAAYLLVLFAGSGGGDAATTRLARITLLDPRTTVPLALAAAILPWTIVGGRAGVGWRLLALGVALSAAVAVLATQTRSMILAMVVGAAVALTSGLAMQRYLATRRWRASVQQAVLAAMVIGLGVGLLGAAVRPIRALAGAIALRATSEGDSGRATDEWIPLIESMADAGIGALVVGAGAGQSFVTGSGQERTYIHNVVLYALYYSGIPGAAMWALGYTLLGVGLFRRGWREGSPDLLGFGALVVALFAYGQFFAVHKLLSYNLLLMLAVQALAAGSGRQDG